ncbi:hypothetical protein PROH_04570 [Prochlorothrix hollandica PCC 9006 = CALU 1027]|uniref:Uncharacterized protein n=1 Tax=Prochlorothrix hollandica PCC 9006 = CALU 1027 TaxID=317619 RepID=A0A0M2PYQ8_PROHO|nr:hypothetical protein PROH_04570 [Prochlorothrix hollandica PCC 9006 = CALU 1027]
MYRKKPLIYMKIELFLLLFGDYYSIYGLGVEKLIELTIKQKPFMKIYLQIIVTIASVTIVSKNSGLIKLN